MSIKGACGAAFLATLLVPSAGALHCNYRLLDGNAKSCSSRILADVPISEKQFLENLYFLTEGDDKDLEKTYSVEAFQGWYRRNVALELGNGGAFCNFAALSKSLIESSEAFSEGESGRFYAS